MKLELLEGMRGMDEKAVYRAMYQDHLTGLLNRRALAGSLPSAAVAFVDVDSLKFINDSYGYEAGDMVLKTLADLLQIKFGAHCTYRYAGDEFVITGRNFLKIHAGLLEVRKASPGISFGIGENLHTANEKLQMDKKLREASGQRAPAGEAPTWL